MTTPVLFLLWGHAFQDFPPKLSHSWARQWDASNPEHCSMPSATQCSTSSITHKWQVRSDLKPTDSCLMGNTAQQQTCLVHLQTALAFIRCILNLPVLLSCSDIEHYTNLRNNLKELIMSSAGIGKRPPSNLFDVKRMREFDREAAIRSKPPRRSRSKWGKAEKWPAQHEHCLTIPRSIIFKKMRST